VRKAAGCAQGRSYIPPCTRALKVAGDAQSAATEAHCSGGSACGAASQRSVILLITCNAVTQAQQFGVQGPSGPT